MTVYFVGHGIFYFSGCYCKKFCAYGLARTDITLLTPTGCKKEVKWLVGLCFHYGISISSISIYLHSINIKKDVEIVIVLTY